MQTSFPPRQRTMELIKANWYFLSFLNAPDLLYLKGFSLFFFSKSGAGMLFSLLGDLWNTAPSHLQQREMRKENKIEKRIERTKEN